MQALTNFENGLYQNLDISRKTYVFYVQGKYCDSKQSSNTKYCSYYVPITCKYNPQYIQPLKGQGLHIGKQVITFTAIFDLSRFTNSCLKTPSSTSVNLIFKSHSFSLNQLTCHYMRETCTAASVYLADVAYIAI
jgi:hypothetical protein